MRTLIVALVLLATSEQCVRAVAQTWLVPTAKADLPVVAGSGNSGAPSPETESGKFYARTREVNVLFSASNWYGKFVSNLSAADVRVLDNGKEPDSLTYFLHEENLPLRVTILIDVSGSVREVFRVQQQAAGIFLKQTLRTSDSASLMIFSKQTQLVHDFTSNVALLVADVGKLGVGGESTAIYDSIRTACRKLVPINETGVNRRALILITDGDDNASQSKLDNAIDAALQSEVVIFALNTNPNPPSTDSSLRRLAESTGGTLLHASGSRELKQAFRDVNSQLRNQYLLGYKPREWQADGSFHRIRLSVRKFEVHVHCRKGYYAVE